MIMTYTVTWAGGKATATNRAEALTIANAHEGSEIDVRTHYTPCPKHPAYEPGNCPACGTAARIDNWPWVES